MTSRIGNHEIQVFIEYIYISKIQKLNYVFL